MRARLNNNPHLEDSEQGLGKVIECASFGHSLVKIELAPKQLHAEQGEDDDEEEEQQQEGGNRLHGVEQRSHEVTKRCPVTGKERTGNKSKTETTEQPQNL